MRNCNIQKIMMTAVMAVFLSACGGGGGDSSASTNTGNIPKPNAPPSLTVTPTSFELEAGQSESVAVSSSDDEGQPAISLSAVSANLKAEMSADGKVLRITATDVKSQETGSVIVTATESGSAKLQASQTINVTILPQVELYLAEDGAEKTTNVEIGYGKPIRVRVTDAQGQATTISQVNSKDPTLFSAQKTAEYMTLTALKTGRSSVTVSGQLSSGQRFLKTFAVNSVGNQKPTLVLSPAAIAVELQTTAQLTSAITDVDGSVFPNLQLSVSSSDTAVATASVQNGIISVTALKLGTTTITATLVDGEHTVIAKAEVTVTPEVPPVITVNNNMLLEMEESSTAVFPIKITGSRASAYKVSVKIERDAVSATDITSDVTNSALTLTTPDLSTYSPGYILSYKITASATDGVKTVVSAPVSLDVIVKTNASPIFEFPKIHDKRIMLQKDGTSVVTITVNDDNPKHVIIAMPEVAVNDSKAGTYTFDYNDELRQLTLNLTGFEKNETFSIWISYKDRNFGGKRLVGFRTYDLSELDNSMLQMRQQAIAAAESARAYQLIGKMYAEYLENIGVVDAQYVDEFIDQLQIDDTEYFRFAGLEGFIYSTLEWVYANSFNNGNQNAEATKNNIDIYIKESHQLSKTYISAINQLAEKSGGVLPALVFEDSYIEVAPLKLSKFVGKTKYGQYENGVWVYKPAYKFLAAIDAMVFENTSKRLN